MGQDQRDLPNGKEPQSVTVEEALGSDRRPRRPRAAGHAQGRDQEARREAPPRGSVEEARRQETASRRQRTRLARKISRRSKKAPGETS